MSSYLNKWGCINFVRYVLPEFQSEFAKNARSGVAMCCIAEMEDRLELQYKEEHYWVDIQAFCERPTPDFVWGECVTISDKGVVGNISEICWHYKEQQYFYHLVSYGKKIKKRYYARDLAHYKEDK